MLCMFQKCCTFAPSKQKDDNRSLILGYGVMVTQQILVLFFLVRVRVAQLHLLHSHGEDKALLGYGVMVTQQILVLFFLVRVRVAQQKRCSDYSGHLFCFFFFLFSLVNSLNSYPHSESTSYAMIHRTCRCLTDVNARCCENKMFDIVVIKSSRLIKVIRY